MEVHAKNSATNPIRTRCSLLPCRLKLPQEEFRLDIRKYILIEMIARY